VEGAVPPGGGGVLLLLPVARGGQESPHGDTCKFLRYGEGVMYKVMDYKEDYNFFTLCKCLYRTHYTLCTFCCSD
jgi:hypothetical protein